MQLHYISIDLDLKNEWFDNARDGNIEGMLGIYRIMKEKGAEEDIKRWKNPHFLNDHTILMRATLWGRPNVTKWQKQELKVDVNEQNRDGNTALHVAALNNHLGCARLLLNGGSQLLKDGDGDIPLCYAKKWGYK